MRNRFAVAATSIIMAPHTHTDTHTQCSSDLCLCECCSSTAATTKNKSDQVSATFVDKVWPS